MGGGRELEGLKSRCWLGNFAMELSVKKLTLGMGCIVDQSNWKVNKLVCANPTSLASWGSVAATSDSC